MTLARNIAPSLSIRAFCVYANVSRQGFYDHSRRRQARRELETQILRLVDRYRSLLARAGVGKVYKEIKDQIPIGRDALYALLRRHHRLIRPRRRGVRTTNSNHHYKKHKNLIKGSKPTQRDQVVVSDITYLRLKSGEHCYASLVTDLYSRAIVGYHVASSLAAKGPLKALRMALKQMKTKKGCVHHSDRGTQYCCDAYTSELKKNKLKISMTEENHCYENAVAERVNGILKGEFYMDLPFESIRHARKALKESVWLYNTKRRHYSLGLKTPAQVHLN